MNILLFAALSIQCMIQSTINLSKVEIRPGLNFIEVKPAKENRIKKLVKYAWENNDIDARILALSYIESRLRINTRTGDNGKACGTFQIHARYSYPMFRRKKGFVNWKESENISVVNNECLKLRNVKYSIKTMKKYLKLFDKKKKHACHHNSGIYGKCNSWYKKRVDFLVLYFNASKINCLNNNKPIKLKTAKTLFNVKKQIAILSKKMKDIIKDSIDL